jgi:hypothetical protein
MGTEDKDPASTPTPASISAPPKEKAMLSRRLRYLIAGLATVAVLLAVVAAGARSKRWRPRPPSESTPFSVSLEDASGRSLRTFSHAGQTWVEGDDGDRFVVAIRNPTADRVEAVISVDGRDALTGRVANFRSQRGYIVPPFGTVRVDGFRQSLDSVATFRFTSPDGSYSARMGTPENVGVIGVAFFKERTRDRLEVPREEARRDRRAPAKSSAPRAGAAREKSAEGNLGTEFGENRFSQVTEVSFERDSSSPERIVTLRYDDADGLAARGIDVLPRERPRPISPRPFPEVGFSEPPP